MDPRQVNAQHRLVGGLAALTDVRLSGAEIVDAMNVTQVN